MADAVLSLEGLTAGYDQAAVIRDVDLTVAAGEVVALLGANGAGKTTTLRAVSGLVKPMARPHRVRRHRPRAHIAEQPRATRHRACAGGARPLLRADGGRALPRRPARGAARRIGRVRVLPEAARAAGAARRAALRRRAADARGRTGARTLAEADAPRRAQPRARPGDRRVVAARRAPLRRGTAAVPSCSSSSTSTSRSRSPTAATCSPTARSCSTTRPSSCAPTGSC